MRNAKEKYDMLEQVNFALTQMLGPSRIFDGRRLDANESAVFSRQLENIQVETYNQEYPALKARTILPAYTALNAGAESTTYRQFDGVGQAKIVHNYETDFPSVEVFGSETTQVIKSLGSSYQYSIQDLRAAAMANFNLSNEKATLAREAIETKLDQIAAYGDTSTGLQGFTNATGIQAITKGSQVTGTTWATATPAEILKDVRALFSAVYLNTKTIHRANTLLLDSVSYDQLANTDYSIINGASTIVTGSSLLSYIQANVPGLTTIIPWLRLDTAGASSKARIMAFDRNPRVAQLLIAQEFEQFPPQSAGLSFKINCHLRTGGVQVRYPLSIARMDGVQP